ncbi:hypothetical protein Htur_3612 [Haloterrigena turkmenica DSM 5511]|uniref:HTH iclR-type domain-containing protein n=1 Tax=Haloterrigena turkmenica (strain ATCC 51198 / DSM 5511 / JCM 9101 / NCIMB 13204 / VKM B-1734 / 4k) TaxID=543526 RepID=D2RR78_HALTV|nr:hypothetical protein [Haloterrigena turkmenica]ADB62474.1 hypothetical protein Htur_3612 [Haloterrigena turkmenica DSM 5511]
MNDRVGVMVVVAALLLAATGPIGAAAGAADAGQSESTPFAVQQDQIDADEVRMDVALRSNGTAEWTLEFLIRLDDEESTTAFESLRDDIRDDPDNHTQSFADRMGETVATAENATGREMSTDGFAVETERQSFAREYGVVRYTFRWHGFAAVEGDELRAGDVLEGIYLDGGTRLLIEWPDGYERTSVAPEPDDERDRAVIWRGGDTDFVSGEPRVVVTATGTGPSSALLAAAVLAVVGLGAAGLWWYRTRSRPSAPPVEGDADRSDPDAARADDATASPPSDNPTASAEPAQSAQAADSSATGTGAPDPDLLSNEEQVLRLVRENGGRMKQQAVVEELEWTDAKTSKVVSGLRDEGKLESFRLGRENVLSLPDEGDPMTDETGGTEPK